MQLFKCFLFLLGLDVVLSQFDFNQLMEVAVDIGYQGFDFISRATGLMESCPFVEDPVTSLHNL